MHLTIHFGTDKIINANNYKVQRVLSPAVIVEKINVE